MRQIIKSVLLEGRNSPYLNDFIKTCFKISLSSLNISKYKKYILEKSGLSKEDFAIDTIADLFKDTDGKYLYIENHFKDITDKLDDISEDIIKAKLNALVISRTNQRITEVREDYGEIYFKVQRAINLYLTRKKSNFKYIIIDKKKYFYICKETELLDNREMFSIEELVEKLHSFNHKKLNVTTIVDLLFKIIDTQNYFLRAISDVQLYNTVSEFYKSRMEDFMEDLKNVHYTNNKEETK